MLWLRTLLFTILLPGTELVLLPFALVTFGIGPHVGFGWARYAGVPLILLGAAIILYCFAVFILRGRGTPAVYEPPRELVIVGLYCYVRNPQYVGVALVLAGEALLTGSVVLFGYAALLTLAFHLFVTLYEEPNLRRRFGSAYDRYRESVPRWLPRLLRL